MRRLTKIYQIYMMHKKYNSCKIINEINHNQSKEKITTY